MKHILTRCINCTHWESYGEGRQGTCSVSAPVIHESGETFPSTLFSEHCGHFKLYQHPEVTQMQDRTTQMMTREFREAYYGRKASFHMLDHEVSYLDRWVI